MSNEEQKSLIQSSDERYNTHTLGQALELRYASTVQNSTSVYNNVRLLKKIVDVCGPVFHNYGFNMNLGLYPKSVYVSMDEDQFLFWSSSESLIPQGFTEQEFDLYLEARREAALRKDLAYLKIFETEFWSLYTIFGILLENFTHTDEKLNCFL